MLKPKVEAIRFSPGNALQGCSPGKMISKRKIFAKFLLAFPAGGMTRFFIFGR